MNQHFNPAAFVTEQFNAMSMADRCRVLDELHQIVGPCAPVPAFEDIADEAKFWARQCDQRTLTIFFDAIFQAFEPERQEAARKYLAKREAGKAEPRGG